MKDQNQVSKFWIRNAASESSALIDCFKRKSRVFWHIQISNVSYEGADQGLTLGELRALRAFRCADKEPNR